MSKLKSTDHQHGAGDLEVARDNVRDQLNATTLSHIETLDQGQGDCVGLDVAQHQLGQVLDELVGNHKDQDVRVLARLDHIGNGDLGREGWNSRRIVIITI